jgi:hypothetical protein
MHRPPPLTFDPAAVEAWLRQPSDEFEDATRAEILGVNDVLTTPGVYGFLNTIDAILAASPDGLHRRADITTVELWIIPDGDVLGQGALVTADLANGVRLATLHQDVTNFADRDQHGVPAVLSALAHIAHQTSALLDTYEAAHPVNPTAGETGATTTSRGSRAPGACGCQSSTRRRGHGLPAAGNSHADRTATVVVEDREGTRAEFLVTDDDGGVILTYNDTPYILATSGGIGWWPDPDETWERLHSGGTPIRRIVEVEGLLRPTQWRDLEASLGLPRDRLGEFVEGRHSRSFASDRVDVDGVMEWAWRKGLPHEDHRVIRYEPTVWVTQRLIGLTDSLGVCEGDLDELVHELHGETASQAYNDGEGPADAPQAHDELHDAAEAAASQINNGGVEAQVRFLVEQLGESDTEARIRAVAEENRAQPATVACKFCGEQVPANTAYRHDGGYVGDCCWDERLRATA